MSGVSWVVGSLSEHDELLASDGGNGEPRDVLGIGALRDALSDAFFPGITTQQSRARYFVLVPAMYESIAASGRGRMSVRQSVLAAEADLLRRLHAEAAHEHGIVGSRSWTVPGRASNEIYWNGLFRWGIAPPAARDRGRGDRLFVRPPQSDAERWTTPPGGSQEVLSRATLELSRAEAQFLRERILMIKEGHRSILKDLVSSDVQPPISFRKVAASELAKLHADAMRLADAYAGAVLLYNRECSRRLAQDEIEGRSAELARWRAQNPSRPWSNWDLDAFWSRVEALENGPRARARCEGFLDQWRACLTRSNHWDAWGAECVTDREGAVKPGRARLSGDEAPGSWEQTAVLHYRWWQASSIIADIRRGLAAAA